MTEADEKARAVFARYRAPVDLGMLEMLQDDVAIEMQKLVDERDSARVDALSSSASTARERERAEAAERKLAELVSEVREWAHNPKAPSVDVLVEIAAKYEGKRGHIPHIVTITPEEAARVLVARLEKKGDEP